MDGTGAPLSPPDDDLVARANGGDPAAFEALYLRYRGWVHALAYRFTRDRDAALDVLQETFLYLLRKFPGFSLTARMTTFLYPVVKNCSIEARRKAERFAGDPEKVADVPSADPPPGSEESDIAAILAVLSEEHRETLLLRFADGLSMEEIAGALGIPVGTVKSRLHRGRKLLQKKLFDYAIKNGYAKEKSR